MIAPLAGNFSVTLDCRKIMFHFSIEYSLFSFFMNFVVLLLTSLIWATQRVKRDLNIIFFSRIPSEYKGLMEDYNSYYVHVLILYVLNVVTLRK